MFKEESEIWKDVPGFEGAFQVSSFGRVRSLPRIDALGHHRKGILRKQGNVHDGYLQVALEHNGKKAVYWVHRLVASAFIPNKNGYPTVNHKDEDKTNNNVSNLEWCTRLYNMTYGTLIERMAKANGSPVYVITSSGHRYYFDSIKKASRLLGLKDTGVHACLCGGQKHHHGYTFELAV